MPVFMVRVIQEKGFSKRMRQSLGFFPAEAVARVAGRGCIWLHAASVGEIVAASPIVKEIRRQLPDRPVLVSAVTVNGYAMAQSIMPDIDGLIYFPLDLPWLVKRVVAAIQPKVFMMVETELWPNFLAALHQRHIPVMMVNGRISDKSFRRYNLLGSVLTDVLGMITRFCMQSAIDAEYIIRLGADPRRVVVTGNTKFDQTYTDISLKQREEIARQLGLAGFSPIIVAGSTHKGEEEIIFSAFAAIRDRFPQARLVVASRDILRADEVGKLAESMGLFPVRRTALPAANSDNVQHVLILDTIGELGKIYSIGELIFVGGSLVPRGGHNILEPAAHGKPVLVGPHMFNFKDTYTLLSQRGACVTVTGETELTAKMLEILNDKKPRERMGRQAYSIVQENRGASRNSVEYLKEIIM